MSNQDLYNKILDDMLEAALRDSVNSKEFMPGGPQDHEFSRAFDARMKRVIHTMRRQEWWRNYKKTLTHVAAACAIIVSAGTAVVLHVDAVRVPVFSFLMEVKDKFSNMHIENGQTSQTKTKHFDAYLPTYVPEGFVLTSAAEHKKTCELQYQSNAGDSYYILFLWQPMEGAIDTENSVQTEVLINKDSAVIVQKDGKTQAFFIKNGHMYQIAGYLTEKEVVEILKSIP